MERNIIIVVSTVDFDHYQEYEDSCSCDLQCEHKAFSLDELLKQDWFLDLLKTKGLYNKDDLGITTEYLNKFVYKVGAGYFTEDLNTIYPHQSITGVFQEVIGTERIKEFSKWKKKHKEYLDKQEEQKKKDLAKKEIAKEKRKLKEIAKAKQLLEQEGIQVAG